MGTGPAVVLMPGRLNRHFREGEFRAVFCYNGVFARVAKNERRMGGWA